MANITEELFGVSQPVIAMAHLPALPGTPRHDLKKGINGIVESIKQDVSVLLDGGVDSIMFCNEDDRPYTLEANFESVAVMTRAITEIKEILPPDYPFGVNYLWDAKASLAVAHATGAAFIREVITGVYESDMGLWTPDAAELYRYRRQIGAEDVSIFANIMPEFASVLGNRSIDRRVKSAIVSSTVDVILVSGLMAGDVPDLELIATAKKGAVNDVPVFVNTGASQENIKELLSIADGVIVGSSLKTDGITWNPVDAARVEKFMSSVKKARQTASNDE